MITINKSWWEHLAPKRVVKKRREVEALLSAFAQTDYGKTWKKTALHPHGVFRLTPGQIIPEIRFAFIGDSQGFQLPQHKLKLGHRTVGTAQALGSGKALADEERVIEPSILIDVVTDPVLVHAARNGQTEIDESSITEPSQVFSAPARMLLAPTHFPKKAFVLYQHIFGRGNSYPNDGYFYVGVTTRSWQKRWSEHKRAINSGSPLLFHRKFREEQLGSGISYVHHKVMGITDDVEALYATEEFLVEGHWEDQRRLNMIPGGKSGLKYLREHGLLSKSVIPLPDDRDRMGSVPLIRTHLKEATMAQRSVHVQAKSIQFRVQA